MHKCKSGKCGWMKKKSTKIIWSTKTKSMLRNSRHKIDLQSMELMRQEQEMLNLEMDEMLEQLENG